MTQDQTKMICSLISYQNVYEISIQFWPEGTTVYIAKGGVDLKSFCGDFDFAIGNSLRYLKRIGKKSRISDIINSHPK